MSEALTFGSVNGHIIGRVLKETARRAMVTIRNERRSFEAHTKMSYAGTMDDVFTSADTKAQEIYLRAFRECFPAFGVIGEEDSLLIEPKNGCRLYFTVDPLDGTKAYVRRQSHGVATMSGLVLEVGSEREAIASCIGDVNANELYYYRPGSNIVHRITELDTFEALNGEGSSYLVAPLADLSESYALLRDPVERYSAATQMLVKRFKNYECMGSSIGTWAARLWKREVSALLLPPGYETPWDSTPVIGISLKLGYKFLRPTEDGHWEEFKPLLPRVKYYRDHDVLIMHENEVPAIYY